MSTYYSLVELFDMENFTYYAWNTLKFFNLERPIFSYEYSLFEIEIDNKNTYIAAFIESAGFRPTEIKYDDGHSEWQDKEFSNTTTIVKFKFDDFASSNQRTLEKSVTLENTFNGRVASAFRLKDSNLICLLFVKHVEDKKGDYVIYFHISFLNFFQFNLLRWVRKKF